MPRSYAGVSLPRKERVQLIKPAFGGTIASTEGQLWDCFLGPGVLAKSWLCFSELKYCSDSTSSKFSADAGEDVVEKVGSGKFDIY